jgi:hypothetical protein
MGLVTAPFGVNTQSTLMTGYNPATYLGTGQSVQPLAQAAPSGPGFASSFAEAMTVAGPIASIFGAVTGAVGSFYAAQSQQNQLKMQAQNQRFAAEMALINPRGAEFTAGQIGREGQARFGAYSMRAGQARASAQASLAARGAVLGVGSAKEIVGSMDLMKEIDRLNISAATVREQEAARLQAFNLGTQATMAGISARNLEATAGTIYPGLSLGTSLLGSATDIAGQWARNRRVEELLMGVSQQRI